MNRYGVAVILGAVFMTACSKSNPGTTPDPGPATVESYAISNSKFKNCHFKEAFPVYGVNSAITPNPISCDEGVAKTVQLLSTNSLPAGLSFSTSTLSLVGTPTEKVTHAPYDYYIENEAGYVVLKLNITVK